MAINIPIITEFVDKGLKSAEAGFDHFKGKVAEAEGGMGKLKAGFGAATDYMKANAVAFASVAGAAIGKFAFDSLMAFQDLALEAGKFSDATGLAVEDASRWIEVAGDIGIESDSIKTSLDKLNKAVATNRDEFNKLGIEIATTDDGATDVNQTFLNTIDRLKAIKDPAERARVAAQLLGKGWKDMAELIQMGSAELKNSLDAVSEAKVINEDELKRARQLREETDKLKDSWDDVKLAIGEALIPLATEGLKLISDPSWGGFFKLVGDVSGINGLIHNTKGLLGMLDEGESTVKGFNDALGRNRKAMNDARYAARQLADQMDGLDQDTNGLIDTWDELLGKLNTTTAFNNVKDSLDQVYEAAGRALEEKTPEAARAAQDAVNALYGDVADYIQLLGDIPADKQTRILTALDEGRYADVLRMLNELTRERTVRINVSGGATVRPGDTPSESRGRGVNVVGPDGRSYYIPPGLDFSGFGKGTATTKSANLLSSAAGSSQPSVTVNVAGSVTSERDLVETIRKGLVNSQRNGSQLVYSNT